MKRFVSLLACLCLSAACFSQSGSPLKAGVHNFTLQWISWDKPGKIMIRNNGDGTWDALGEQRSPDKSEYATIDGFFKVVSATELEFNGIIRTCIKDINNGQVCEKKGRYHFIAKGTRKYWRLKEMNNCEGDNVVDYVDVYF